MVAVGGFRTWFNRVKKAEEKETKVGGGDDWGIETRNRKKLSVMRSGEKSQIIDSGKREEVRNMSLREWESNCWGGRNIAPPLAKVRIGELEILRKKGFVEEQTR